MKWFNFFQISRERGHSADGPARRLRCSPHGRVTLHDDGVVFLHIRSGVIFRSNRIGAEIWKGLLEEQTLESIAGEISREYSIPREQAFTDASQFAADLEAQGLLVRG